MSSFATMEIYDSDSDNGESTNSPLYKPIK